LNGVCGLASFLLQLCVSVVVAPLGSPIKTTETQIFKTRHTPKKRGETLTDCCVGAFHHVGLSSALSPGPTGLSAQVSKRKACPDGASLVHPSSSPREARFPSVSEKPVLH